VAIDVAIRPRNGLGSRTEHSVEGRGRLSLHGRRDVRETFRVTVCVE
jgi:hypothetical protein